MDVGSERSWGAGDFAVLLVYIGGTAGAGGLGAVERSEPGGRAEGGREGRRYAALGVPFFCRPLVPDGRGEWGRDN